MCELYRELMRRGAREYLVAPLDAAAAHRSRSPAFISIPSAAPIGRVVAFVGARGGVGLVHPRAQCRLVHRRRTARSTPPSSISTCRSAPPGLDFNEDAGQGVADALAAPERLDDVLLDRLLIKRGEHLSLFAAPARARPRLRGRRREPMKR